MPDELFNNNVDFGADFSVNNHELKNIQMGNIIVDELSIGSTIYPRVVFNLDEKRRPVKAEIGIKNMAGIILKRNNRSYTMPTNQTSVDYEWSFDFVLPSLETTIKLNSIYGWGNTPYPTLEEFYGNEYNNTDRKIRLRYLGYVGMLEDGDGIYQPNEIDDQNYVLSHADTYPNGYVSYDDVAGNLTFSAGAYGPGTVYRIQYMKQTISEGLEVND